MIQAEGYKQSDTSGVIQVEGSETEEIIFRGKKAKFRGKNLQFRGKITNFAVLLR